MSTRSFIGYIKSDNSIEGIYCHWDGYPKHHLLILEKSYIKLDKVLDLIKIGPISELNHEIGEQHSFHSPTPNWVISYPRDRREGGDVYETINYSSVSEMKQKIPDSGMDYFYLYSNGIWEVFK